MFAQNSLLKSPTLSLYILHSFLPSDKATGSE